MIVFQIKVLLKPCSPPVNTDFAAAAFTFQNSCSTFLRPFLLFCGRFTFHIVLLSSAAQVEMHIRRHIHMSRFLIVMLDVIVDGAFDMIGAEMRSPDAKL